MSLCQIDPEMVWRGSFFVACSITKIPSRACCLDGNETTHTRSIRADTPLCEWDSDYICGRHIYLSPARFTRIFQHDSGSDTRANFRLHRSLTRSWCKNGRKPRSYSVIRRWYGGDTGWYVTTSCLLPAKLRRVRFYFMSFSPKLKSKVQQQMKQEEDA